MTDLEYRRRRQKIERRNESAARRQSLRALRQRPERRKIETNKLIAFYLFLMFNVIIIYALVVMWELGDLSYLGVLISDIAAQVLVYAIYCIKAFCGKREEERLRFERDKLIILPGYNEDDVPADCEENPTDDSVG